MNLKQLNELLLKYIDQVRLNYQYRPGKTWTKKLSKIILMQLFPAARLDLMLQVRYLESRQDMQGSFTVNVDR